MSAFLSLALIGIGFVGATHMTLHTFKDSHPEAQCSDGSPAGMYVNTSSTGSNTWIIFLEGGGWCFDEASCKARASDMISSKGWTPTEDMHGILSPTNPVLTNANYVYLRYCTNDAWSGSVTSPFPSMAFSMLGRVYINAVIEELISSYGLGSKAGTNVMFTGCSAGARGALFNTHFVSEKLKATVSPPSNLANFGAFYDSAWWVDIQPLSPNAIPFSQQVKDVYALINGGAEGYLNPSCMAAFPGTEGWKCMMGEFATNYTQENYMVHVYQFDAFQLGEDIGTSPPKTPQQLAYANTFRADVRASASSTILTPARAGTAALLPACYHHCNTGGSTFTTAKTNGVSLEDVVSGWFGGLPAAGKFVMEDCNGFACGQNCPT